MARANAAITPQEYGRGAVVIVPEGSGREWMDG